MLKYNFTYELKLLLRSRWIQLLSLTLIILFGFSTFNGLQKLDQRKAVISEAMAEVEQADMDMEKLLDSVAQGLPVSASRWTIPTNPMAVGNYYPRVAAMEPPAFAFIATGQSDMYTSYVKPKVSGDDFALNFTEMTSPVQLLFGSFDLAFVIVYLLPLLIIAFSYNILSAEKEQGTLRLLGAQPMSIRRWMLQKLALRFFWLSLMVVVVLILTFTVFGAGLTTNLADFFALTGLILAYMLFWFVLAFLVNLSAGSSAKNAVSMLGLWVILVLLVPSALNQVGNTAYPIPSRTLMINDMRAKKTEVSKKQDEILDAYLRDHPEYAINDTAQARNFYHRYIASQELIKKELAPVVGAFEAQLEKQQEVFEKFKWLSPALVTQQSLNTIAGSSTADYESYRKQVIAFAGQWRDHLSPMLYNNQQFTASDIKNLPHFIYKPPSQNLSITTLILVGLSLVLIAIGWGFSQKRQKQNGLIGA
ncbi:DUF3526 domain-containing protein [Gilvibacter sp.]|uniref:DUF3526 domain-containing protein n=1 Tax=Gilvibacter sp. TaxID=2729997 RepID=UPI0025C62E5B|nr:DUF3526 domain-containing protein [Gilvibacter sp.]NQX76632.1 DUF3526 domain-containing protein [Gilvibacter sp.]